jgi:hypothetical protein
MHHRRSSLVPLMFITYYQQHLSIALYHAQAIVIFQRDVTFGRGSSPFPHTIANAPPTLTNLWHTNSFSS